MSNENLFKALADPTKRKILLLLRDGKTEENYPSTFFVQAYTLSQT